MNGRSGRDLPRRTIDPALPMVLMAVRPRVLLIGPEVFETTFIGNPLPAKVDAFDLVVPFIHAHLNAGDEHAVRRPACIGVSRAHRSRGRAVASAEIFARDTVGTRLVDVLPTDAYEAGIVGALPRHHAHERAARAVRVA